MKKAARLVLMLLCGSIATATFAQVRVVGPEYVVVKSDARPVAHETSCKGYFLRSEREDGIRIGFSYVADGIHSENPRIGDVSVVIDESKASPTFMEAGEDPESGRMRYVLRMNSATANREATCLAKIPVKTQ
jgi:hypothetical protein